MARPTKNLRLFVAAYPPRALAQKMLDGLERVRLPDRARSTPLEQIHLTLQFIGDVPAADLDATIESVRRAASGLSAFTLGVQGLIALPERGHKRLIAAEIDAPPTLLELQKRLALRLAAPLRDKPTRGFRPHITLCRFASPTPGFAIGESSPAVQVPFTVRDILLMRSTLTTEGATHHLVERVMLESV